MMFLDESVINCFHSEFTSAPFLHKEMERIRSLGFAFLDRGGRYIKYLNEHSELPRDETEIVLFFVYSCWILDGAEQILSLLFYSSSDKKYDKKRLKETYNDIISKDQLASKRYFRIKVDCNLFSSGSEVSHFDDFNVKIRPLYCRGMCKSGGKCPHLSYQDMSDDRFFLYLRSLIFAHPFETDRDPKGENDMQASPFAIPGLPLYDLHHDDIVVRIYSGSGWSFDRSIIFSFSALKNYICSRYSLINKATERIRLISDEKKVLWKQHHVNRDLKTIDKLKDIKRILKERYSEGGELIDTAIEYLSCEITVRENEEIIQKYRDKIISIIPSLCDAVDEMNYEVMGEQLWNVLYARPEHMHEMGGYQLEKIFDYLQEKKSLSESDFTISANIAYGLWQAKEFANGFAKKWVTLKPYDMNFCEIRLVVSIACYFERMKECISQDSPSLTQMEKQIT